ncbi:MAG: CBS domain-containing protein [Actinomycetota bacterium]|nr:CBS domain-containing protein [Actinomycetota bacterium]
MRIRDIMQGKGGSVVTASPDTSVRELVALLAEHNIGAVVVSSAKSQIAGIVSERDVVRGLAGGVEILDSPISEIMTSEVRSASPRDTVDDLMRLMTEHRIRHVPVMVDGSLQGIVSIGDVVKSRMGELEFERDQLSSYVSNTQ